MFAPSCSGEKYQETDEIMDTKRFFFLRACSPSSYSHFERDSMICMSLVLKKKMIYKMANSPVVKLGNVSKLYERYKVYLFSYV